MRYAARAIVGIILIACSSQSLAAAEATSSWWPFGHHDDAKVAQPPSIAAPSTTPPVRPKFNGTTGTIPPLGAKPSAPLVQPTPAPNASNDTAADKHWMLNSSKGKVGWPHLTTPHLPGLSSDKKTAAEAKHNTWADKTPVTPKPSPLKPITDGAHSISKSTKAAWHKTVNALTPGESTPSTNSSAAGARIAKREAEPPFYKRMFGAKSEPQGAQTVPEFMAQQRLDP